MPILATKAAGSAQGFGFSGGPPSSIFICATGGTVTTSGDYKIHTFTGPGSFVVNKKPQVANATVDYLVVAGGGGASAWGGSGAGGFREGKSSPGPSYSASPLVAPAGIPVTIGSYPITVGGGGTAPAQGTPSIFSTITSAGGAKGPTEGEANGFSGGSGSGASQTGTGGAGNTPPTSPPQGQPAGPQSGNAAGTGGGGATGSPGGNARNGGAGATTSISASPVGYAGGGGGSDRVGGNGPATDGGGNGGPSPGNAGSPGTANRGGGGGGGSDANGGNGGSGIVIIRYKFQ